MTTNVSPGSRSTLPAAIQAELPPKRWAKAETFAPTYRAWLARWPVRAEERTLATATGRTHLLVFGDAGAPPLVVLHGAGSSALGWVYQAEAFARGHRVYALDMPGHYGLSVSSRPARRMAQLTAWLGEVLDALGLARAHLLGHSFGGQVALHYALHAPERVHRLVLIAPGAVHSLRMAYLLRALSTAFGSRRIHESLIRYLGARVNDGHEPYETRLREAFEITRIQSRHFGLLEMPFPRTLRDDELRALSVRTLLVIGEHEVVYDARRAMARAAALVPDLRTALIAGAGHLVTLSHAEALEAAIVPFLAAEHLTPCAPSGPLPARV